MRLTKEEKVSVYWLVQEAIQNLEEMIDDEEHDEETNKYNQKQLKKLQSIERKISKDVFDLVKGQ